MKEFLNRFSFGDFVAYFLPGLTTVTALAGVLYFTPFRRDLATLSSGTTLIDALLVGCAAYLAGAIVSGMGARLLPPLYTATRLQRFSDPRSEVVPVEFAAEVKDAFARIFGPGEVTWGPSHFYLLRSTVHHVLPHAAVECSHQNSLMQLRANLLLPILTWGFVGTLYSIDEFARRPTFSAVVGLASLLGAYFVAGRIASRAVENRRREVREVCLGFLVAERLELLRRRDGSSTRTPVVPYPPLTSMGGTLSVHADTTSTA